MTIRRWMSEREVPDSQAQAQAQAQAAKSDRRRPIPAILKDLNAVACALITRDGALLDANPGFMWLVPDRARARDLLDVRDLFIQPRFDQFAARHARIEDRIIYSGVFNMGDVIAEVRSLNGNVYADGDDLLLIAEYDIAQAERHVAALRMLNEELAGMRRENARLERKLKHRDIEAAGAIADSEALLEIVGRKMRT